MIEVEIAIGGHKFRIACEPGEEDQLDLAAKLLDREALALQSANGRVPETKMLLMAGLMLGDKIKALEWEKTSLKNNLKEERLEIQRLKKEFEDSRSQSILNFDDRMPSGDISEKKEMLALLESTANRLDEFIANFSKLKDRHSADSSKVTEAVEVAFD